MSEGTLKGDVRRSWTLNLPSYTDIRHFARLQLGTTHNCSRLPTSTIHTVSPISTVTSLVTSRTSPTFAPSSFTYSLYLPRASPFSHAVLTTSIDRHTDIPTHRVHRVHLQSSNKSTVYTYPSERICPNPARLSDIYSSTAVRLLYRRMHSCLVRWDVMG